MFPYCTDLKSGPNARLEALNHVYHDEDRLYSPEVVVEADKKNRDHLGQRIFSGPCSQRCDLPAVSRLSASGEGRQDSVNGPTGLSKYAGSAWSCAPLHIFAQPKNTFACLNCFQSGSDSFDTQEAKL